LSQFSLLAHADDLFDEMQNTIYRGDSKQYVLTFKEDGIWRMQVFESVNDGLQDLILEKQFDNSVAAIESHTRYLRINGYSALDDIQADQEFLIQGGEHYAAESGESIWPVAADWNFDWEKKYSAWVENAITLDFFQKYNIPTDCADVVIASRWIFARMNGLPVANSLSGSGRLVGQMTMRDSWRELPTAPNWYDDQRFRAALTYVMKNSYTKSLGRDSYPVAITREQLIPGTHHLEFHSEGGGHAMLVKKVTIYQKGAGINTYNSTLPVKVRKLIEKEFMGGDQPDQKQGFQRVRWPVLKDGLWGFADPASYPGYALEQFQPEFMEGFGTFQEAVKSKLSGWKRLNLEEWQKTLDFITDMIKTRANVVYDGFFACQQMDCRPGTAGWDEWSTPGRDDTLRRQIQGGIRTIKLNKDNRRAVDIWDRFMKKRFAYDKNLQLTNEYAVGAFNNGLTSSDPRHTIQARWGL
jgi:hypothetical protein